MHRVERGEVAADQVVEHVALAGGDDTLAERADEGLLRVVARGSQPEDAQRRQRNDRQHRRVFPLKQVLDRRPDDIGERHRHRRGDEHAEGCKHQCRPLAADVVVKQPADDCEGSWRRRLGAPALGQRNRGQRRADVEPGGHRGGGFSMRDGGGRGLGSVRLGASRCRHRDHLFGTSCVCPESKTPSSPGRAVPRAGR